MKKIYLFIMIFLELFNITAHAQKVRILCPKPSSIVFNVYGDPGRWNRYRAVGYSQISSNNAPSFAMTVFTDSHEPVIRVWGASYAEQNTFICCYTSVTNQDMLLVYNRDLKKEYPKDCHFEQGDPWECDGNEEQCALICER